MKAITSILTTLLLLGLTAGCRDKRQSFQTATAPASESRIISLYDQLKIDMSRSQVQAILGEPISSHTQPSGEEQCDYIKEPERTMESHESPMMIAGISVRYKNAKLTEKNYNSQWVKREHSEAYEKKKNSEQVLPPNEP